MQWINAVMQGVLLGGLYALFAAGCEDGTPASSNGTAWVHFDRQASSLEEAIRSAVGQIQAAGFGAVKVEIDADVMALP